MTTPLSSVSPADEPKIWIVSQTNYDEYSIIGIYTTEQAADAERERCEESQREHNKTKGRHMRDDHSFSVTSHKLNHSRAGWIVRKRKDGTETERHFSATLDSSEHYERTFEGRAPTIERATELADAARAESHA